MKLKRLSRRCHFSRWIASIAVIPLLGGCATVVLTALGVGGTTAINHTLSGISYKTFTAPLPEVRTASIGALDRMGIKLGRAGKAQGNDVVTAVGRDRDIEIVLEPITAKATRMRVIARSGGLFFDRATSTEIIVQTERVLRDQTPVQGRVQAQARD